MKAGKEYAKSLPGTYKERRIYAKCFSAGVKWQRQQSLETIKNKDKEIKTVWRMLDVLADSGLGNKRRKRCKTKILAPMS